VNTVDLNVYGCQEGRLLQVLSGSAHHVINIGFQNHVYVNRMRGVVKESQRSLILSVREA